MFKIKEDKFKRNVDFYKVSGFSQPTHDKHKNNITHDFSILSINAWLEACGYELMIREKDK